MRYSFFRKDYSIFLLVTKKNILAEKYSVNVIRMKRICCLSILNYRRNILHKVFHILQIHRPLIATIDLHSLINVEIMYFIMFYLITYRFTYIIEKYPRFRNNGYSICFWKMALNCLFLFIGKIYYVLTILINNTIIIINREKAKNGYMLCWFKMNENLSAHI